MKYYLPISDKVLDDSIPENTEFLAVSWIIPLQEKLRATENTAFIDGRQFAFDSTSLANLRRCPRYYQYTSILGYKEHPTPPALAFGIALHTVFETYHKLRAGGMEFTPTLFRCVRLAGLLGEYLSSLDTARTKESLVRTVVWYLDRFENDPAETVVLKDGSPAVEYSFTLPFTELDGVQVYLCGHIDRVVKFMDDLFICDLKTTKHQMDEKYASSFKMSLQIRTYVASAHILAGQVSAIPQRPAGALIDGVQLGVNYTRFQRFPITFTSTEIDDFLKGLYMTVREAWMYAEAEEYPMRETGCFAFGGTCPFLSVCSKPPAIRQRELDARFVKSTWDPLMRR